MGVKLYNQTPKRFFAFGCSFTHYNWSTWADIIGCELGIPYWNYGKGGGGNQYIFNTIMQADSYHNFTDQDLVIVCWTNVCREDRYIGDHWETPGNIFNTNIYDAEFICKWVDPVGYAVRDFATIKAVDNFLENKRLQYHFLKMINLEQIDQLNTTRKLDSAAKELTELYAPSLNKIQRSYFEVLWNNDINIKFEKTKQEIGPNTFEVHPTVNEHFEYLQTIFDYEFSNKTKELVADNHNYVMSTMQAIDRENNFKDWWLKLDREKSHVGLDHLQHKLLFGNPDNSITS